jgi:hypothetical protein
MTETLERIPIRRPATRNLYVIAGSKVSGVEVRKLILARDRQVANFTRSLERFPPRLQAQKMLRMSRDRRKFERLAAIWKKESAVLSSPAEKALLPSYQRVIGMGPVAVPFILEDLQRAPNFWFWALRALTGKNPVPESSRGRVREMAEAWLDWGRRRGLI